jgi:hypothetical protein
MLPMFVRLLFLTPHQKHLGHLKDSKDVLSRLSAMSLAFTPPRVSSEFTDTDATSAGKPLTWADIIALPETENMSPSVDEARNPFDRPSRA